MNSTQLLFYAHKSSRLHRSEEQLRGSFIDAWHAEHEALHYQFSKFFTASITRFVRAEEDIVRRQLGTEERRFSSTLKDFHMEAWKEIHLFGLGTSDQFPSSEAQQRIQIQYQEVARWRSLTHTWNLLLCSRRVQCVIVDEERWRSEVVRQWCSATRVLREETTSWSIVKLQCPQYHHAEQHYRVFVDVLETKQRQKLATAFCLLKVQWREEWSRIKLRISQKTMTEFFREYFELSAEESNDRADLRCTFHPFLVHCQEHAAATSAVNAKRQRKMDQLRALKAAEEKALEEAVSSPDLRCLEGKVKEISKILQTQESLLNVANSHSSNPDLFNSMSALYSKDIQRLSQPSTTFLEMTQYHSQLLSVLHGGKISRGVR